eukprot:224427-Rhodomonas_salina.1
MASDTENCEMACEPGPLLSLRGRRSKTHPIITRQFPKIARQFPEITRQFPKIARQFQTNLKSTGHFSTKCGGLYCRRWRAMSGTDIAYAATRTRVKAFAFAATLGPPSLCSRSVAFWRRRCPFPFKFKLNEIKDKTADLSTLCMRNAVARTVMFRNKPPLVGSVLYHTGGGLFRNITVFDFAAQPKSEIKSKPNCS